LSRTNVSMLVGAWVGMVFGGLEGEKTIVAHACEAVADGAQAVVITVGGVPSPPNAYITIAR